MDGDDLDGLLERLRTKLRAQAYSAGGVDVPTLFRRLDQDKSGYIEYDEFAVAARRHIGNTATDEAGFEEMFDIVDLDADGLISRRELRTFIRDGARQVPEVQTQGYRQSTKKSPRTRRPVAQRYGGGLNADALSQRLKTVSAEYETTKLTTRILANQLEQVCFCCGPEARCAPASVLSASDVQEQSQSTRGRGGNSPNARVLEERRQALAEQRVQLEQRKRRVQEHKGVLQQQKLQEL